MKKKSIKACLAMVLMVCLGWISWAFAGEEKPLAPDEKAVPEQGEEKPTASGDLALLSKYIWRGWEYTKDSVVVQPSATLAYKGFRFNVWGNLDTDVYSGANEGNSKWTETDLTFGYDTKIGMVGLGAGYIYYALDSLDDSKEVYATIGLDTFLAPTFTVYREIAAYSGWYMQVKVSQAFELPYEMKLNCSASAAYSISRTYKIVEYDDDLNPTGEKFQGFQDGLVSVGLTIPFAKYFTVQPLIAYSFPLSSKADNMLRATSLSDRADHFYGGVILSVSF